MEVELSPRWRSARPSEIIGAQRMVIREQAELIDVLKGALAVDGAQTVSDHSDWMRGLTPQERALVGALYSAYPRIIPREALIECLPSRDHVLERQLQTVDMVVHKVRGKLGAETVVTHRSLGFQLGESFYRSIPRAVAEPRHRPQGRSFELCR